MKNQKKDKKVYVFIDASNLWEAQKSKGEMFDYEKLKKYLRDYFDAKELKVFYYTAFPEEGTRDYSLNNKHKFFTYLKRNLKFVVRKKKLKRIKINSEIGDSIEEKGNMDVELAIDVIHFKNSYDTAVFFTGDADFMALINYVKNGGKKAYVFSSRNNVSKELRGGSDGYIDVLKVEEDIWGRKLEHNKNL